MLYLSKLFTSLGRIFFQFPLACIVSVWIAIFWLWLNHAWWSDFSHERQTLLRLLMSLLLILPLSIVSPLIWNINQNSKYEILWQFAALLLWIIYFFVLPVDILNVFGAEQLWIALSMITAWLLPLVWVIFALRGDDQTVWWWVGHFVFKLFIACISAGLIWWGIVACLSSIEYLFKFSIEWRHYVDVWVLAWSLWWVWIWLNGLISDFDLDGYPKLLRFFWLYIFFPLSLLYACILAIYGIQIGLTQERPNGLIVRMVIGYTVFGLLWVYLTFPLRNELLRVRSCHSVYFVTLLLFSILLFFAIGFRLQNYGLTSHRYLIVAFGLWIIWISIWGLRRRKNIIAFALSLVLILLLWSVMWLWNAVSLPKYNQYNKLIQKLESNQFLENGLIKPRVIVLSGSKIFNDELKSIYDITMYLSQNYGTWIFATMLGSSDSLNVLKQSDRYMFAGQFMRILWADNALIEKIGTWWWSNDQYLSFYSYRSVAPAVDISDYHYYLPISNYEEKKHNYGTGISLEYEGNSKEKMILRISDVIVKIDLYACIPLVRDSMLNQQEKPPLECSGDWYKLFLTEFNAEDKWSENYEIANFAGYVFVR